MQAYHWLLLFKPKIINNKWSNYSNHVMSSLPECTANPQFPLDTCPLRCGSDPVLLCRPLSSNPNWLRFESTMAQYGRQLVHEAEEFPR